MSRDVKRVLEQDTARTAARIMRDENIGFLPVCDTSGRAIGAITDRDLAVRLIAEDQPVDTLVGGLMTRGVVSCSPEDDVTFAEQLMRTERKLRVLCVDEGGHVVGVLSLADVAVHEDGWRIANTLRHVVRREGRLSRVR